MLVRFGANVREYRSHMSGIMSEVVEMFMNNHGYALDLRHDLIQARVAIYAEAIQEACAPLEKFVGFIYCTKTRMNRPSGQNSYQGVVYSSHKKFHCLIYQSLTTSDTLIFGLFGPEIGRRHDLTLLREIGWN